MKLAADTKHRDDEFEVGDLVYLKLQPLSSTIIGQTTI